MSTKPYYFAWDNGVRVMVDRETGRKRPVNEIVREAAKAGDLTTMDQAMANEAEEIIKFNPNHDNLGRFSSSGGGGSAAGTPTGQYSKEEQIKAIKDWSDGEYGYIRQTQRGDYSGDDADKYKRKGDALEEYIDSQPSFTGDIYRGISTDTPIDFRQGQKITMNGTSSWSKDEDIADEFSQNDEYSYFFVTEGCSKAADISQHAMNPGEQEVLVSKDVTFEITYVEIDPDTGQNIVVVKEVKE